MVGTEELKKRMEKDPALAERIRAAKSLDELVRIAEESGISISEEAIEKLAEVSDEDIRKAAGGISVIVANAQSTFNVKL